MPLTVPEEHSFWEEAAVSKCGFIKYWNTHQDNTELQPLTELLLTICNTTEINFTLLIFTCFGVYKGKFIAG